MNVVRRGGASRATRSDGDLLLGEWACLGLLCAEPRHGFAVAALLRPDAEIGRIWSLSRPLTYRALDQLVERGFVAAVGSEPGAAGPNRTILAATGSGRTQLRRWLQTPVEHLRDLRSELLLKIALAGLCGVAIDDMLITQQQRLDEQSQALAASAFDPTGAVVDAVSLWRYEATQAGLRFLARLG